MRFKIQKEMKGDVAILHVNGSLVGGPPVSEIFPMEINNLINSKIKKVVIDLDNVKRMNSTGLGILIKGFISVRDNGGDLRLARLKESAKDVMVITKLDSVFKTFHTLEGAVRNFH